MEVIIFMSRKNSEMLLVWQNRIEACSASNLNIKQWCEENGFSAYQYHYWKKKINEINSNVESNEVQLVEINLESQKSEKKKQLMINQLYYITTILRLKYPKILIRNQ